MLISVIREAISAICVKKRNPDEKSPGLYILKDKICTYQLASSIHQNTQNVPE